LREISEGYGVKQANYSCFWWRKKYKPSTSILSIQIS